MTCVSLVTYYVRMLVFVRQTLEIQTVSVFLSWRIRQSLSCLAAAKLRQSPGDLARILERKLQPIFMNRQETLHMEYVTGIRDFDRELPAASSFYNAFRRRKNDDDGETPKTIPHSFTFARRESALASFCGMNA